MFRSALICTDCADGLQRLVHFVPHLAAGGLERLVFFYNVPLLKEREIPRVDEAQAQRARDRLQVAVDQAPPGITVQVEIQPGRVGDNILRLAREHQTDVIFLGMTHQNVLSERLFGSTTMGLAQRCVTPLFTLRPELTSTYTTEELALRCQHLWRYLLLPYDGSKAAKRLIEQVKHYCQAQPNRAVEHCLLYWVIPDTGRRELRGPGMIQPAEAELATVQAELAALGISVEAKVVVGEPIAQVFQAAMEYDISAIALASNSLGKLLEWSVPSFAGEILRQSWHPVLYFPPTKAS